MRQLIIGIAALGLVGACSTTAPTAPTAETTPPPLSTEGLSDGVAWVAAGDGWADEALAVYDEAKAYVLATTQTLPNGGWAVVLDLDETVINNVEYQIERERLGESYTPESWYDWTQEQRATLVPGVEDFITAVNAAGGHVAFVTNRSDRSQLATEENLAALGLTRGEDFRVLMTKAEPKGESAKDARYALVPELLAVQGYPDVETIAYIGDNKGDKPELAGEWVFFCIDQGAMYGDPCAETPGPGQ